MDGKLWRRLYAIILSLSESKRGPRQQFSDREIVAWFLWAVLNDRPMAWLQSGNHLPAVWKRRRRPSAATLCRRLKTDSVLRLLTHIERFLTRPPVRRLCKSIDGKPLPIGHCSQDCDAGYGRRTKGYRLHVIVDGNHAIYAWSVLADNINEVVVARQLIPQLECGGYLIGDGEYDAAVLHDLAAQNGHQFVAPRAKPGAGFGHRPQSTARKRSCQLLERDRWTDNGFGKSLMAARRQIERFFGNLTAYSGGLTHLPPWVRTLPRVNRWVQAKLAINAVRIQLNTTT